MKRRDFVAVGAGVAALAAFPACASFVATPVVPVGGELRLTLRDYPALEQPGGWLKIRPTDTGSLVYVMAQGGGAYTVLSSQCTHLACTVNVEGAEIRCPCHGSTFDREGRVLLGPAERPLHRYASRVTPEGELVITWTEAGAGGGA